MSEVDPGEGYRLLSVGEIIERDDDFKVLEAWHRCFNSIGKRVETANAFRRSMRFSNNVAQVHAGGPYVAIEVHRAALAEIERLKAELEAVKQLQPEPEPEWFDLTPFGEHVLRRDVDWVEYTDSEKWQIVGISRGAKTGQVRGYIAKARCLLKDAPPELVAMASKPAEDAYGYCPICGAPGVSRERRLNGNDLCSNGHEYPSKDAMPRAKPNSIVFHEFIVKHSWDNEPAAYHLEWSSDTREHANWIPTGRTETREVVR